LLRRFPFAPGVTAQRNRTAYSDALARIRSGYASVTGKRTACAQGILERIEIEKFLFLSVPNALGIMKYARVTARNHEMRSCNRKNQAQRVSGWGR